MKLSTSMLQNENSIKTDLVISSRQRDSKTSRDSAWFSMIIDCALLSSITNHIHHRHFHRFSRNLRALLVQVISKCVCHCEEVRRSNLPVGFPAARYGRQVQRYQSQYQYPGSLRFFPQNFAFLAMTRFRHCERREIIYTVRSNPGISIRLSTMDRFVHLLKYGAILAMTKNKFDKAWPLSILPAYHIYPDFFVHEPIR